MKIKITKYVIAGMAVLFGIVFWMTVDRAINIPNSSHWLIPAISFALFFITLIFSAILIKRRDIVFSITALGLFASLYFSFSALHILALLLGLFLIWIGLERISSDLHCNVKISITKSVRMGKSIIILALSIAITSQYYTEVKNNNQINIIPEFEMGSVINRILPMMYPDFKGDLGEDLTVDEFISEISEQNTDSFLEDNSEVQLMINNVEMSDNQMMQIIKLNQNKIIEEERKNLSKMVGMPLIGDERIADVFSKMINDKINSIFTPSLQSGSQPILPWIASLILFLTVASLGSLIGSLLGYIMALIFWLMRKVDLVKVSKVSVDMEVIE